MDLYKAIKHIPFHLLGYHWCRSHTKKWANLILGPDNLSVYPILHLRTKEKRHAHFKDNKNRWEAPPPSDTQRFNLGLHMFILTVLSLLGLKNGNFASFKSVEVVAVVWSGDDGYGRQPSTGTMTGGIRVPQSLSSYVTHILVLETLWPLYFLFQCYYKCF